MRRKFPVLRVRPAVSAADLESSAAVRLPRRRRADRLVAHPRRRRGALRRQRPRHRAPRRRRPDRCPAQPAGQARNWWCSPTPSRRRLRRRGLASGRTEASGEIPRRHRLRGHTRPRSIRSASRGQSSIEGRASWKRRRTPWAGVRVEQYRGRGGRPLPIGGSQSRPFALIVMARLSPARRTDVTNNTCSNGEPAWRKKAEPGAVASSGRHAGPPRRERRPLRARKARPRRRSRSACSLHIGLNAVNPAHYAGWSGPLKACEFDAADGGRRHRPEIDADHSVDERGNEGENARRHPHGGSRSERLAISFFSATRDTAARSPTSAARKTTSWTKPGACSTAS